MSQHPPICLRYFDARARAQFARAYFDVRGIVYEDDRVPLDEGFASWAGMRDDRSRTGPMQRLPVLHFGDELIPETIVIGNFVHRRLGDANALTDDQNLQHEVILSVCNIDLMLPLAMLIWADLMFDGIDLASYARKTLDRIERNLEVLEKAIDDWGWVADAATRPVTVADCILWEELDQAQTLFGSHLSLDAKPLLARFHDEHPSREAFEKLLEDRPCQVSGRPGEAAAIERVRELLA
jgi:glutathione S-transferase